MFIFYGIELCESAIRKDDNICIFAEYKGSSESCIILLQISASCDPYANGNSLVDSKVHIHLPKELDVGSRTIVFCMVTLPESSEVRDSFSPGVL